MRGDSAAPPIPHCRSLSLLGERSACTLWAADSDTYGGAVTVTVYNRRFDAATADRFDAAVEAATRLGRHPHLVAVHGSGRLDDGRSYVVGDGHERTTAEGLLLTAGVLDVERVLRMGIALAGALETAHRAGVVHGGVSPALVLVSGDGRPVLTEVALAEFGQPAGISAFLDHSIPYHAPPEVLESTGLSPATDVYSLASVVYTLLVGDPPHAAHGVVDSTASLLLRILQMPMPTIQRSDVPPGLEDTLRTALAHVPDKRPQQVLELAWALQEAQRLAGMDVSEPVVLDGLGGPGALRAVADAGSAATGGAVVPSPIGGDLGLGDLGMGLDVDDRAATPGALPGAEAEAVPAAGALSGADMSPAVAAPLTVTPPEPPAGGHSRPADDDALGGLATGGGGPIPGGVPAPPLPAMPPPVAPPLPLVEAHDADEGADAFAEGLPGTAPSGPLYPGRLSDRPLASGPLGHAPLDDPYGAAAGGPNGEPRDDLFGPPVNGARDDLFGPPMNGRSGSADGELSDAPGLDGRNGIVGRELGDGPRPGGPTPGQPPGPGLPGAAGAGAFGPLAPWAGTPPASDPAADTEHNGKRANGLLRRNGANGTRRKGSGPGDLPGAPVNGTSRRAEAEHDAGRGEAAGGTGQGADPTGDRPWWAIFGATTVPEAKAAPESTGARTPGGVGATPKRNGSASAGRASTSSTRGRQGTTEHVSALERARAARLERQRSGDGGGAATPATTPREPRGAEPPAAPADSLVGRARPPALPVIVLVALVVVLGIGGAFLVVTGEDSPAEEAGTGPRRQVTATSTTVAPAEPTGPSNLRAVETNDGGVQLDWDGPDTTYTVQILANDAPPRAVPGGPASALMIPAALLTSSGGMCFEVTEAPAPAPTAAPPGAAGPATTPTSAAAPGSPATTAAGPATTAAAPATTAAAGGATTTAPGPTTTVAAAKAEAPIACVRGATPASVRRQ